MHRVSPKTTHIYPVVEKQMPIEPVVVPDLFIVFALQVRFEMLQESCIMPEIVDEHSRTPPEVVLRACKERSAYDLAFPHRSLLLDVKVHCLSIPGRSRFRRFHQDL
jgi:hypothetical protein